jgi:hypothetical protein
MRTQRYAIAAVVLAASTILMSCGSDNDSNPSDNSGAPVVADSTIALNTLPIADTLPVAETTLP